MRFFSLKKNKEWPFSVNARRAVGRDSEARSATWMADALRLSALLGYSAPSADEVPCQHETGAEQTDQGLGISDLTIQRPLPRL